MFWRKKKPAAPATPAESATPAEMEIMKILGEALAAAPRVEGAATAMCRTVKGGYPGSFVDGLGPALREDLGGDGKVVLYYNADEQELVLRLVFCYGKDSAEMAVISDCLDTFDLDEEDPLPGSVCRLHTKYIIGKERTENDFISEGVTRKGLRGAADRLLFSVFDWLDIVYEAFQEEFGEGDYDEEDE